METEAIAAEGNSRRYAKSTLVTAAISVLLFLLSLVSNVTLSVKYAERELDGQLRKLAEVFRSHDFPQNCRARTRWMLPISATMIGAPCAKRRGGAKKSRPSIASPATIAKSISSAVTPGRPPRPIIFQRRWEKQSIPILD